MTEQTSTDGPNPEPEPERTPTSGLTAKEPSAIAYTDCHLVISIWLFTAVASLRRTPRSVPKACFKKIHPLTPPNLAGESSGAGNQKLFKRSGNSHSHDSDV